MRSGGPAAFHHRSEQRVRSAQKREWAIELGGPSIFEHQNSASQSNYSNSKRTVLYSYLTVNMYCTLQYAL